MERSPTQSTRVVGEVVCCAYRNFPPLVAGILVLSAENDADPGSVLLYRLRYRL